MSKIELPMGLGMALAQNESAMQKFESLTEPQKQAVINATHSVKSKREMRQLVRDLSDGTLNV
ncbi:MAG: hypothetical protein UH824_09815 [Acutalibacteraceae bacterium]|nr:hypothetical protein [Acutalibacteraceae bacterium]